MPRNKGSLVSKNDSTTRENRRSPMARDAPPHSVSRLDVTRSRSPGNCFLPIGKPKEPRAPLAEEISPREQRITPTKQKTVLLPGTPPEIAYAPPQPTYYEARSGVPFHNAIGTETKKTVRMDESTENSRRIVTVEQTSRVIKFGDQQPSADFKSFETPATGAQRHKTTFKVPTPTKFVQGSFRESDYESDIDTRIKPKWAPADSDTEEPRYRKVQPPSAKGPRSFSAPVRQEHVVSPMEFDTGPPIVKRQTSMTQLRDDSRTRKIDSQSVKAQREAGTRTQEDALKPGSPPEFGYISRSDVRKAANRKNHVDVSVLAFAGGLLWVLCVCNYSRVAGYSRGDYCWED